MIIDQERDFFDSAACGSYRDASHRAHESGYGRETEKKKVEIHIGIAFCAVDARLCANAVVPYRRRYSRARFHYHVPDRAGSCAAKFTLGEETLRRFQAAFSEIWSMDRLGHAPQTAQEAAG